MEMVLPILAILTYVVGGLLVITALLKPSEAAALRRGR
jgi:hypothetical protein